MLAGATIAVALAAALPPAISSSPPPVTSCVDDYVYAPAADGDPPLTWSLVYSPPDMTVDAATGELRWRPEEANGSTHVVLRVQNAVGSDEQVFDIAVLCGAKNYQVSSGCEAGEDSRFAIAAVAALMASRCRRRRCAAPSSESPRG